MVSGGGSRPSHKGGEQREGEREQRVAEADHLQEVADRAEHEDLAAIL